MGIDCSIVQSTYLYIGMLPYSAIVLYSRDNEGVGMANHPYTCCDFLSQKCSNIFKKYLQMKISKLFNKDFY